MTKRVGTKVSAVALAFAATAGVGLASASVPSNPASASVAPAYRQSDDTGDRVTVDDLVYDHFGAPYRSDGVVYKGVTVGAPPWGAHEALPVAADPGWNFYEGTLFREETPWEGYVNIWGQLFPTAQSRDLDARLQVRNPQLWYLGADDRWRKVKPDQSPDSRIYGNFQFPNTFRGTGWPDSVADIRPEGPGQGWSLKLGPLADVPGGPGSWHWFYNDDYGVKPPVPRDMKALFVAAEMRLIHDVDTSVDLDEDVNVIASIGSDNWPTASGPAPRQSGGPELSGFVQPRMKFVTSEWNWYSGHTFAAWYDGNGDPLPANMNDELLRRYPPPLVGTERDVADRPATPSPTPTTPTPTAPSPTPTTPTPTTVSPPSPLSIVPSPLPARRLGAPRQVRDEPTTGLATFRDDFDGGGTTILGGGDDPWQTFGTTWTESGGHAQATSESGNSIAVVPTGGTNVKVETSVTLSPERAAPGVALRARDRDTMLTVSMVRRSGEDRVSLHAIVDGRYQLLAERRDLGLELGETYDLSVAALGQLVSVSVDGRLILLQRLSPENVDVVDGTAHGLRSARGLNGDDGRSRYDSVMIRTL